MKPKKNKKTLNSKKSKTPKWIEIHPYGVTMGADESRPVMIFKDDEGEHILPIWITPQEAHLCMSQVSGHTSSDSPHNMTFRYFEESHIEVEECRFVSIKGHNQYVDLHFRSLEGRKVLQGLARDMMSFCLHSDAKFYATADHMTQSRRATIDREISEATSMDTSLRVRIEGDERYLN